MILTNLRDFKQAQNRVAEIEQTLAEKKKQLRAIDEDPDNAVWFYPDLVSEKGTLLSAIHDYKFKE